ncbi:MAG: cytochrome P450 [Actinomycetota bacterium]
MTDQQGEAGDGVRALARDFSHHDEGLDVAFDVYRELRDRCPVGFSERYGGFWFVTQFDDIHRIEQDPETFAVAPGMLLPPMGHVRPGIPIDIDPPMHPKYRKLMLPAFTPHRIDALEPMVRRVARDLLDEVGDAEEFDASKCFAVPLPMIVFCEIAGLPTCDSEKLEDWINRIFYVRTHDYADTERAAAETCAYLAAHFEARRNEPPSDDLLGRLLTAEIDGRPLTDEELVDYGFVLLTAGLDTTAWVIRSGLWYLAQHPDDLARLVASPELVGAAVEEFLRTLSSVQAMARTATRDVKLDGCPVSKGERVLLVFGAGNRDEAKFPGGDRIAIDRQPNPHMAFGVGIHRCLGSNLARRELRVALEEFIARYAEFSLAPGSDAPWHGIGPLPLVVEGRR